MSSNDTARYDAGTSHQRSVVATWTRIWIYDPQAPAGVEPWSHVRYQFEPKPANAAWIGLSEITLVDDGWILIERDNLTGDFGVFKKLAKLPLTPGADGAFTGGEKAFYDLRPRLDRDPRLDHRQAGRRRRAAERPRRSSSPTTTASTAGRGRRGSSASAATGTCSGRTVSHHGAQPGAPRSAVPDSRRPHVVLEEERPGL